MPQDSSVQSRLQLVEERILRAAEQCGRKRSEIKLVAVSKKFSATRIVEAYEAGLRDFGENYIQEFGEKRPQLNRLTGARFHLIGHLQSNKARLACDLFDVVQTVDSPKLMKRLDSAAREKGVQVGILLEVKLSAEESKTGCSPKDLGALVETAADCKNVSLSGLMTMPPWSEDPEQSRPYFQSLAALARQYGLHDLSMGMSGDFEVAIQEGATMIRVGTALFGRRPKVAQTVTAN